MGIATTVLTSMAPFILKMFGLLIDKIEENKELKKLYLSLIEKMESEPSVPAQMKKAAERQRKKLLSEPW